MSQKFLKILTLLAVVLCLGSSGCVSSYVDNTKLPKLSYLDVAPKENARPLNLVIDFQTFGKHNKSGTKGVAKYFVNALEKSKQFSNINVKKPADDGDRLEILMNNYGDVGDAVGKGVVTGVTFGIVGNMVTDNYSFKATFYPAEGGSVEKTYEHAIHSVVGNKEGPPGMLPTSMKQAFRTVIDDLVLNFLSDIKKEGYL